MNPTGHRLKNARWECEFYPNPDQILFYPSPEIKFYPFIQKERHHPIIQNTMIQTKAWLSATAQEHF